MHDSHPLASATLSMIPSPVLARMVMLLTRAMRRRHPRLVENFSRLDRAVMHIELTDLPHRFAVEFGDGRMDVRVLLTDDAPADATIRGSLTALIALLEGRIDSDALFFTREIEITGSTAVTVAVRNTLDREEIILRDEIASAFGPLERPARRIARRLDSIINGARTRIATVHARLHEADAPPRDFGAECDALRAEVKALKTRLAKFDVRQMRTDTAATGAP
jgi:O2-independent ubiquinone biosynthesis accessory factor UbiT